MPGKRRRKKRRRQEPVAAATETNVLPSRAVASEATEQTTGCSADHPTAQPELVCPAHIIQALCMKDADTCDEDHQESSGRPEQSSSSSNVGVVIGQVENLWLSETRDEHADPSAPSCGVHTKQQLEFLCQKCDVMICRLCKLAEHEGHESRSLGLAVADSKQRIADARSTRLSDFRDRLLTALRETEKRGDNFRQTRKEVEETIRRRHAQLVDMIDRYRDSALLELEAMGVEGEGCAQEDGARLKSELCTLSTLERRIDHSLDGADPGTVLSLDREIQADWSREKIMVRRSVSFPSYNYELKVAPKMIAVSNANAKSAEHGGNGLTTGDLLEKVVDCFIGHPFLTKTPRAKFSPEVKVTPKFRCCEDPESLVLSVCPTGTEKLAVSYSSSTDYQHGVTKTFFVDGKPSKSFDFGLCTLCGEGNGVFAPVTYNHATKLGMCFRFIVSKSGNLRLLSFHQDTGWFIISFVRLPPPLHMIVHRFPSSTLSLPYKISSPLNFDVTRSSDVVAIVDLKDPSLSPFDNSLKNQDRVVKVVSFSGDFTFVDVYDPPLPECVPSDVCFYDVGGRTVLLVSDQETSSIHVLDIQPVLVGTREFKQCRFQRYLVADCETMQYPTALNTDEQGRLWVACRGGHLLTVEVTQ